MMGLRNLMLKANEMADSGLEVTVFCQQSSSVTKPSAITCKNVTELSSFMNYWNTDQDIYFPNVRSIHYDAFHNAYLFKGTIHLNVDYRSTIMGSSGYPLFNAWRNSSTFIFDINAAKLTINKSSDVTTLWVDDLTSTADYEWIPKDKDVPIIALSDTAVLVDTVNTPTDLTYTITMPSANPIGINLTGVEGTASTAIKYGAKALTTKAGLNPYLYAPSGTTLNYDMLLTTSDGGFYTYTSDLTSLVDITTADMVARQAFFKYNGTIYYVTDTLTTFDDLYSWISSNYSSSHASNMTELYDSNIETLSTSKLEYNNYLKLIYLAKCTSVGVNAFAGCSLKTVTLPKCTSVGASAFYNCRNLTTINLPKCTSVGASAFDNCGNLTTINLPECTSVGASAFYDCGLKTVTLPKCISVGDYAFQYCTNYATDFSLPVCESIGTKAFYGCYNLKTISLPNCTSIADTAFGSCSSLTEIHFATANQATIEALSGYSSKFGASSATIYFDL